VIWAGESFMSGQRPVPPPLLFANYSESAALRVFRCKSLRIKVLGLLRMEPVMEPDLLFVPCFMMIEFAEGQVEMSQSKGGKLTFEISGSVPVCPRIPAHIVQSSSISESQLLLPIRQAPSER
jgi:hypothetical protein